MTDEIHSGLDEAAFVDLARTLVHSWRAQVPSDLGFVVGLLGDLGAGKTRFVQAVVEVLNGSAHTVTSPTYALVHIYPGEPEVRHLDLYRLDPDGVEELGPEVFEEPGWVFVEWVERAPAVRNRLAVEIRIAVDRQDTRRVQVRDFRTGARNLERTT